MRNLIGIASFLVALIGALGTIFNRDKDKQTMSAIVAAVFLLSFFINIDANTKLVHQMTCLVAFAMAILSGVVAMFSKEKNKRDASIVTGTISLFTSLLILFIYL
jgi:uncharacterized membrane protein YoaK (UPF0700 family)